ncbi:MAG: carboxylating nicotinate-nucleotide diphosphorylase [Ignavibacterium sp.]|nr:carboxylating nicotinate-nucleotide diphosphorylase [Ignavibacterium sp.]MCX7611362.1 carboxylating nicotinate-nucleotide diphosphorylase [Ignavibacterium sp.]MDW8374247.1 carboxylating nicotinate-nucleotide diphosphorylase [Ignavibacteriales bacterium]
MKWNKNLDAVLNLAINEDIGSGDITTNFTIPSSKKAEAILLVKSEGIISGLEVAKRVFAFLDKDISFQKFLEDGDEVFSGTVAAIVYGNASSILTAERTALNFLQRMSGISTITKKFVDEISHTKVKILDTRKTAPCLRYFDKYAVKVGGGENHRFGLFDMILIKDNHIVVSGSITNAVKTCREKMKQLKKKYLIEVETKNLLEVEEALENRVDIIMLDNFSINQMKKAVNLISGKCKVEASGGITLKNVKKVAETGVDFISIGALTHSVKALDISLDVRVL